MKATFPMPSPPNWHALMRAPIVHGLLLSACAHLAAIALLQPAPGSNIAPTLVINARLEPLAAVPTQIPQLPPPAALPPGPDLSATPPPAPSPPLEPAIIPPREVAPPSLPAPAPAPVVTSSPTTAVVPAPVPHHAEPSKAEATVKTSPGPEQITSNLPSLPLGVDTSWYLARQVDVQPRALGKVEPVYPPEARRRNQEGSLKLMVKIDNLGRVQEAEVVEAHPPGVFDEAALEAFRKARFHPAMRDGRPVRMQAYIRVDFKLED